MRLGRGPASVVAVLAVLLTSCTGPTPAPSTPAPSQTTTAAPTPTPTPTVTAPTQTVVFGDPWSRDQARVHAVVDEAFRIIDETPAGATISLSMFNMTHPLAATTLIRAYQRGVHVRVVVNAAAAHKKQVRKLRAALGTRTSAGSWVVVRSGGVRMHSKFMLSSHSGDRDQVVWVSSGNFTNADGAYQVNESLITTGDKPLYSFLTTQFALLRKGVTDPAQLGRTATTPTVRVRTFPQPVGGKANDPVEALLDNVTCRHGGERTVIRLAHLLFKDERLYLAERLRALATQGCDVRVIGHMRGWDPGIRTTLTRAGSGRIDLRSAHGTILHTKITTVDGWDAAGQPIEVAMVGTHNLSGRATAFTPGKGVNDELSLMVSTPSIVKTYNAFVDRLIRKHSVSVSRAG